MNRKITASEAKGLLREAVKLNITDKGRGSRFATERDEILADLQAAGYPTNYADYSHPSEV